MSCSRTVESDRSRIGSSARTSAGTVGTGVAVTCGSRRRASISGRMVRASRLIIPRCFWSVPVMTRNGSPRTSNRSASYRCFWTIDVDQSDLVLHEQEGDALGCARTLAADDHSGHRERDPVGQARQIDGPGEAGRQVRTEEPKRVPVRGDTGPCVIRCHPIPGGHGGQLDQVLLDRQRQGLLNDGGAAPMTGARRRRPVGVGPWRDEQPNLPHRLPAADPEPVEGAHRR